MKNKGGEAAWEQLFEETEKQPTIEEQWKPARGQAAMA